MRIRVFDLDGSITAQDRVLRLFRPDVFDLRRWGPRLRLGCAWKRFYRFERQLDRLVGARESLDSCVSLLGSSDFHHLSLAFLRRVRHPFNLLVLDKHPGWLRGVPILHHDTWLNHASRLGNVRRIFHLGGDAHFDNALRWLAPKKQLQARQRDLRAPNAPVNRRNDQHSGAPQYRASPHPKPWARRSLMRPRIAFR